jgi:hypothetical protein
MPFGFNGGNLRIRLQVFTNLYNFGHRSFRMSPSPFLSTYFQLLIKRARHCSDDLAIAGQPPDLLALFNEGFVG